MDKMGHVEGMRERAQGTFLFNLIIFILILVLGIMRDFWMHLCTFSKVSCRVKVQMGT